MVESTATAAQTHSDLTRRLVCVQSCLRSLSSCGLTDDDIEDVASCLDYLGRDTIIEL